MDDGGITQTLEHYLRTTLAHYGVACRLAVANVHAPTQQALEQLGPVTVETEGDIGDASCIYAVEGPGSLVAIAFLSTVLPYAAVMVVREQRYAWFADAGEEGWPGAVVSCLEERGFLVLPGGALRAKRPDPTWPGGPRSSYFEDLFQDEFGPPEDRDLEWIDADDDLDAPEPEMV